jgi:calcineurin-like phosphoesterase family protein
MNNWFTADTHFQHANIIKHASRPFSDVDEMNETLIQRWNILVQPGDIVYHLGDFGWKNCDEIIRCLQGQKFLIKGSHDSEGERLKKWFCQITSMKEIKIGEQIVVLSHCAMRVWEKSHYGSWHLYGHSHGKLETWGKSFDVGVDTHNFYPYSWYEVVAIMATLEPNHNDMRYRETD